jgi:hypothetical protein
MGSIPDEVNAIFNDLILPAALWPSGQLKMSTRNLPGGKGRLAHKADNFTAIYETNV